MNHDASTSSIRREFHERAAWAIWALLLFVVCCYVVANPGKRSVTPAYRHGSEQWVSGKPLYNGTGGGFIYLPQSALIFAPFAMLPESLGEVLWRCLTISTFAVGTVKLVRLLNADDRYWLLTTLVSVPLAFSGARNGQATLLLAGLSMLSVVAIQNQQWWRATSLLVLALCVKPLAAVLLLLGWALYRPLLWRIPIGIALVFLLPFVTQDFDYVIDQYVGCMDMLRTASARGGEGYWPQLFGLLKVAGWDTPPAIQFVARLTAAASTLGVCWLSKKHLPAKRAAWHFYALSSIYLMLFNPRTEGNTYAMVGPVYGLMLSQALWADRRREQIALLIGVVVSTILHYELGRILTPPEQNIWVSPLMCSIAALYLAREIFREILVTRSANLIAFLSWTKLTTK